MNNILVTKIKKKLANNYLIFLSWAIIVLLSSLITITQGLTILKDFYNSHFLIKENLYSQLNKLYPNTNIDYIKSVLGSPQIVKGSQINKNSNKKEYIFINKYYYVQTIVDDIGAVLAIAITSRDKNFNPTFIDPSYNGTQKIKIILNKTSFYEYSKKQGNCIIISGARRHGYYEEFYLANPGNYQSIIIGLNDSSYMNINKKDYEVFSFAFTGLNYDCNKIPQSFRKNSINTFIITAPFVDYKDLKDFTLGANLDDVRVFD